MQRPLQACVLSFAAITVIFVAACELMVVPPSRFLAIGLIYATLLSILGVGAALAARGARSVVLLVAVAVTTSTAIMLSVVCAAEPSPSVARTLIRWFVVVAIGPALAVVVAVSLYGWFNFACGGRKRTGKAAAARRERRDSPDSEA